MMRRLARATRNAIKVFRRDFEAAGGSGRWPMSASLYAQPAQAMRAAPVISRRASWLVQNSPAAASFVGAFETNLVGDGPIVKSAHPDPGVREDLENGFADWAAKCDAEGMSDLTGLLCLIVRSTVTAGEAVVHMPVDERGTLSLRVLAPEQLDASRSVPPLGMTGDLPRIVSGVETDASGRRTGYWILPDDPGAPWASVGPPVRVPAEDIAHLFDRKFPGQTRGLSWLTPIATRLLELDALEDAALAKAKVNALFTGFVRDLDNATGLAGDGRFDPATLSMEPGTLRILPPGADITFSPTIDMSTIGDLLRHMQRSVASGGGVPYELLSGDLSQTNYSSAKLGQSQFQRRVRALQATLLVARFLLPVWQRFVLLEILTGRMRAPDFERNARAYLAAKFIFPGWPALDPLKEAKADVLSLNARTRSRAEIIADNGRDVADVDQEIESDPLFTVSSDTATALLNQPDQEAAQNA